MEQHITSQIPQQFTTNRYDQNKPVQYGQDASKRTWGITRGVLLVPLLLGVWLTPAKSQAQVPEPTSVVQKSEQKEVAQLKLEIEDLRTLLDGNLPKHNSLPALFEITLSDESAVNQRAQALNARTQASQPVGQNDDNTPAALRTTRDALRLAFLNLSPTQRNALVEQDRLARKSQALASEQQSSVDIQASTELARDNAMEVASKSTSDVVRTLATEESRLLAHLSELASLRQTWIKQGQGSVAEHSKLIERYKDVDSGKKLSPEQADPLYKNIRADLRTARTEADAALTALTAPIAVVPLANTLNLDDPIYARHPEMLTRLRQLREQVALDEADLRNRESLDRYAVADEIMRTLNTLQSRRIKLLPMLSPDTHDEATGFTDEGFDRIVSEVKHVSLMVRWYPVQRMHDVQSFASLMKNIFVAGRFGAELLGLIAVLGAIFLVMRRGRGWLGRLRVWLSTRINPRTLMLRIDGAMQMLMRITTELLLLLTVYVVFDWFFNARDAAPEWAALRKLAYSYAYYALALAFMHRILLVAVSRYREVDPSLNEKILKSLRLAARVVLVTAIFLILAQAMLGRGALYGIAKNVAIISALIVAWRLIRNWRAEVTQAYLNFSPIGKLADLVRASQGRSHSMFIVAMAFIFVAARGLWIWLRDSALGFEQTRKALAYLFRRQLERQSKNQQTQTTRNALPIELQEALTEEAISGDLCLDNYPQLDAVLATAEAMRDGKPGALIAITGDRGSGKTSWLLAFQQRIGDKLPCVLHTFETRTTSREEACRALSRVLAVEETTDATHLIQQVLAQPPQVVLLDLGQNLALRAVGGIGGYELFIEVAQATMGKIVWVIAFASWPFEYLQRTFPGRDIYHQTIALRAWNEQQIGELIDARMERAGFTAEYDQLLLNAPTFAAPNIRATTATEEVERTADRYNRLIWDYSDGNPRVALHFFRLSLNWVQGTTVSVRLFSMPAMSALEKYHARTHFILACLLQHENLTAEEAAASLRFPVEECAHALELLCMQEFLSCGAGGRYRIACHWSRAILRFLQRKKLLAV